MICLSEITLKNECLINSQFNTQHLINIFYGRLSPKEDFKLTMIVEATNKRTK